MPPTEMAEKVMKLSDEDMWKIGTYSLLGLPDGCFRLTCPVLFAREMHGLEAGDEIQMHLHRSTGALILWPDDAGPLPIGGRAEPEE